VATTTKDIYGGRDPRDVSTYSIKDARLGGMKRG
jgi:hypothetical protein